MTPDRGRARVRRRRRAALGHRLRHRGPLVRQHHRHAQGRHPPRRVRAGAAQDVPQGGRGQRAPAQGRQRQAREGRRPRGPDRGASPSGWPSRSSRGRPRRCSAPPPCAASSPGSSSASSTRAADARPSAARRQQAALLLEKVVAEMKSRISARQHKETQRRKNALETSSLPAKLADCRSDDVERSELFIVEGDSALGTAKLARSSRLPGAAADPRQDPQRPEGLGRGHAQERRVRRDHPGHRRRLGPHVRPRRRRATARSS